MEHREKDNGNQEGHRSDHAADRPHARAYPHRHPGTGETRRRRTESARKTGGRHPKPAAKPSGAAPKPAKSAAARKPKAPEVTVTLSGTAEGEWTVDVVNGKKRTVRGLPVSGAAVAQAAKLLHPEVAEVVDSILESVRTSQRAKVEQLQAELEQARKLLDELTD
nr:DUF6319 family protein [Nocardia terpenica]